MTREEILSTLIQIISDQLGVPVSEVTEESHLVRDLGADSLDLTELVMAIEDEFSIEIPDEQANRCTTVGQALAYLLTISDLESYTYRPAQVVAPIGPAPAIASPTRKVNPIKILKKQAKKLGVYDQIQDLIAVLENPVGDKDVAKKHIKTALKRIFKQ